MSRNNLTTAAVGLLVALHAAGSRAQVGGLTFTKTVDPTQGAADFQTISGAVGDIDDPDEKWTVLVFAGTCVENVTLGPDKQNIDIVGVDPDAVIIAPPAGSDAITIQGDGQRNNTIRNLTIITAGGRSGIVIRQQTSNGNPGAVAIDGVRIRATSGASTGVRIEAAADDVQITNCAIEAGNESRGVWVVPHGVPANFVRSLTIRDSRLDTRGGGTANWAIDVAHPLDGFQLSNVYMGLDAPGFALRLAGGSEGSRDLNLAGVVIRATQGGNLIDAALATGLRVSNCDILDVDADFLLAVGANTTITNSSLVIDKDCGPHRIGHDDGAAVQAVGKTGLRISGSRLQGREGGLRLLENCRDVVVSNSELGGVFYGVRLECGEDIQLQHCRLFADERLRRRDDPDPPADLPPQYAGLWLDEREDDPTCEPGRIELVACDLRAVNEQDATRSVFGVLASAAPTPAAGPARLSDCAIDARRLDAASAGRCFGAAATEAAALALVGGVVASFDADERDPNQFDLLNLAGPAFGIRTSGTRFSKWKGPIAPAVQAAAFVQREVNVAAPSDTAILSYTSLTPQEQPITSGITAPDVYRVLAATRVPAVLSQSVYVIGTDVAGNRITEVIQFGAGEGEKSGLKPFQTVAKIILPAQTAPNQTLAVGTNARLGLRVPISAAGDVQQQARKAADAGSYVVEAVGSVDATFATVDVGAITAGDSFEFTILAGR